MRTYLTKERLNPGGYNARGRYFGYLRGTSVYRYTLRQRLARALDAVLASNLDLTSIALDTGFASHSHFTARFRAFFGLTPEALRRRAGSGSPAELRKIVTAQPAAAA